MSGRFFDHDPFTGITQIFHYDPHTDTVTLEDRQDVEANVEHAKRLFNNHDSRRDKWGDFTHVAHIPAIVLQELMITGKLRDQAYMKKWLNDPDNAVFRTRPGTV